MKGYRLHVFFLALAITMLACGNLRVVNQSPRPASVRVSMPDGSTNVVMLDENGGEKSWFSWIGGGYEVAVLPIEGFVQYMKNVQASTVSALLTGEADKAYMRFFGADTDFFSALQAFMITEAGMDAEKKGVVCGGEIPDTDPDFDFLGEDVGQETVTLNSNGLEWTCK